MVQFKKNEKEKLHHFDKKVRSWCSFLELEFFSNSSFGICCNIMG